MKIVFEALHSEHVVDEAMINFEATHTSFTEETYCIEFLEDEKVTGDRIDQEEALLRKYIDANPFGNYHATGLGTYVIYDEDQVLSKVVKEPESNQALELWTLHFHGARCKVGAEAEICLTSPFNEKTLWFFRFQFTCSNNEAKYEGLVQGLSLAEQMGIKQLMVFRDSKPVDNQF